MLLITDNATNTINEITGPFDRGSVFVAETPCDENIAPCTCPDLGFPANFLGQLNPYTGVITAVGVRPTSRTAGDAVPKPNGAASTVRSSPG